MKLQGHPEVLDLVLRPALDIQRPLKRRKRSSQQKLRTQGEHMTNGSELVSSLRDFLLVYRKG